MPDVNLTAEIATASVEDVIRVPFHVFIGEATDAAAFFARRWARTVSLGRVTLEGLESVKVKLPESTGTELLWLIKEAQSAQTAYLLAAHPNLSKAKLDRGLYVESELESVLDFYFDDGVEDQKDAQLASINESEAAKSGAIDALGVRIGQLANLASGHSAALDGLGGFDSKLIVEGLAISGELLALPPPGTDPNVKAKLDARNQVLAVTQKRVNKIRSSAVFVYRDRPEISREATSSYERKRKAAARRAAAAKAGAGTPK